MRIEWLAKEGNNRLILIFAGWGTDASFYVGCLHEGWDLAVASGYSDLSFPDDILLPYHSVVVFAWSMGVYAASRVMTSDRVALAVAVNGTESPADDRSGIPTAIFDGTADSLNERNLMKFRRRMTGKDYDNVRTRLEGCVYDIEQLRDELRWIRQESSVSYGGRLRWQRAYISTGDLIFPPESQRRAWEQNPYSPEIVTLDAPHYIDLSEIIHSILPSGSKVGERFMKASATYDSQAHAQREITLHLAAMGQTDTPIRRVIEIGPGTGMLTRLIDERWHPEIMEPCRPLPYGQIRHSRRATSAHSQCRGMDRGYGGEGTGEYRCHSVGVRNTMVCRPTPLLPQCGTSALPRRTVALLHFPPRQHEGACNRSHPTDSSTAAAKSWKGILMNILMQLSYQKKG